jgi:hypothetical protein
LFNDPLRLAVTLGLGYVAIKYVLPVLRTATAGLSQATSGIASGVANAYVAATAGPAITPAGSVVLSTGQEVPVSQLTNVKPTTNADGTPGATFSYGGSNWTFTGPADSSGTYYAVPL